MTVVVDLVVPVKSLRSAKTRLRGVAGRADGVHTELVLAMVLDTVLAARATARVGRVLVVTPDSRVNSTLRERGFAVCGEGPVSELNAAYRYGAAQLAATQPAGPARAIGALQADLPALRPADLDTALATAAEHRVYCPDRQKTGTTLLVSAVGEALDPRFGPDSAHAHHVSGARQLTAPVPTLRCDVDTAEDLAMAAELGLGPHTSALLDTLTYAG
ncbi:2-phospho-L-lactate guanylyltransferase [Tamaricihabitans halophyticus]|uniref:Phosphoenolpyruvate guanylyltransferase n=1 Tax=Tamaricihabitans halophyticus TaxID=1262583 RepID=A0A4R2QY55_9PSEU|nr:2-phospho-L-lactate guanylyltransferase [Tamaricihabitans halophyticus]TCP52051.1 2-phospho-L-lactate guanylyltransferase [Tamaricihabitans halophyticus]